MTNLIITLFIMFLSLSCSRNVAGGSELPNGKVEVALVDVYSDTLVDSTIDVTLKSLKLTSNSFILQYKKRAVYDELTGKFIIDSVPTGNYSLFVASSKFGAVVEKIKVEDSKTFDTSVTVTAAVTLKGRALVDTTDSVKVAVIGSNSYTSVDSLGFYTVDAVFSGVHEINFIANGVLSAMTVKLNTEISTDTVFVRDCRPVLNVDSTVIDNQEFVENDLATSLHVEPEVYSDTVPQWYVGKDFSSVTYFEIDTTSGKIKPVWRFPVLIGVKKETEDFYGGREAFEDSVKKQFETVNNIYNLSDFDGRIEFAPDSIYTFSGSVELEDTLPPQGYSVRMIYDGYQTSTLSSWNHDNRVFYFDPSATSGSGMFSDYATELILCVFGLYRGATYLPSVNVDADSNSISHTAFTCEQKIMSFGSLTEFNDYNYYIINANADLKTPECCYIMRTFPDTMGVSIMRQSGDVAPFVAVKLYGVRYFSYRVDSLPTIDALADSNGTLIFGSNPYMSKDGLTMEYRNLLVEVDDGLNKVYSWLPYYTLGKWWFEHGNSPYYLSVVIP